MRWSKSVAVLVAVVSLLVPVAGQAPARNVVVITIDGLRWQEVFGGADRDYFEKSKDHKPSVAEHKFWRESADERRRALMPFLWTAIAQQGQIFGDRSRGSRVHVTNGLWFSYPGYNEMFSGAPDPRVDSNDKVPNPNVTVFEWLNERPGFSGHVLAFGAWDVLPFILNTSRSHVPVGFGFNPVSAPTSQPERAINQLAADLPPYWDYGTYDAPFMYAAWDALRTAKPRVLYVMLGEGDEWAHAGRYDLYLDATHRADDFIRRTWELIQTLDDYRGTTTLLLTTDHGRGAKRSDWTDHGRKIPAAADTWMAALGPSIQPLGVRESVTLTTSQLAATIAAVLGEDFQASHPSAAPPIPAIR